MITGKPQKNLPTAIAYFKEHLARGEYYSQGQSTSGQWLGNGAQRLTIDLSSPVDETSFTRLCHNLHPVTGEKLTPRLRKDRRIFYDFTASAPKSVSIMALTAGDKRILTAHRRAWQAAFKEMEKAAETVDQRKAKRAHRLTGELVAAAFEHHESRSLDPQLHTHLIVWNLTYDPQEKRWKALESSKIFEQISFLTQIYRAVLAKELVALGYNIHHTEKGAFEIEGVNPDLINRFSKRSRDIKAAEAKIVAALGKPISNNARATLAHTTRAPKKKQVSQESVIAFQQSQLAPEELMALQRLVHSSPSAAPRPEGPSHMLEETFAHTRKHLFERHSVVWEHAFIEEALKYSRGKVSCEEIRSRLSQETDLIQSKGEITTKAALELERQLIQYVNQSQNRFGAFSSSFSLSPELFPEQKAAVELVLCSTDGVIGLRGGAGTGKTRVLTALVSAIEQKNQRIFLVAPTSGAVDMLRKDKVGEAITLQRFLLASTLQEEAKGSVVLVDEAGLISTAQMAELFAAAQAHHFRVILSGDTRQHHSVEAGDALRILEKFSPLKTATLSVIHRQKEQQYRKAILALAENRIREGFECLNRLGAICEAPDQTRYLLLAQGYLKSLQEGKSALCVSPSWREISAVTEAIRSELKTNGSLQQEAVVSIHIPLHWTQSEKVDLRNYQPEHILLFHKKTRDFDNGQWGIFQRVEGQNLVVLRSDGRQAVLTKKQTRAFSVFRQEQISVGHGEKLLVRGNAKAAGLLNGQIVSVKSASPDGRIILEDGREIPAGFRRFAYGYCVTSIGSQGKTADHVYLAVDSVAKAAVDRKQFYVSASRGRKKVQIFTDDKKSLLEQVSKDGERKSAIEFANELRQSLKPKLSSPVSVRI